MAETDLGMSVRFDDIEKFDGDVNKVEKSIDDLSKNAVKSLDKVPESATKSLRAQIREAQQMAVVAADTYGDYSKEAVQAYKQVANLRDKQEDLNRFIEYMNPDKFQVAAKIVGGLAAGVQTASGAMALLGFEGENATKVIAKLQAISNLAAGLQNWKDFSDALKNVSGNVIPGIVKGWQGLDKTMKASIIGAVAAGVIALIQNWNEWFGVNERVIAGQKELNDIQEKINKQSAENIAKVKVEKDELNKLVPILTDASASQEKRKNAMDRINKIYPELLKGLDTHNLSEKTLQERLSLANAEFDRRILAIQAESKAMAIREKLQELYKQQLELEPKIALENFTRTQKIEQDRLGLLGQTIDAQDKWAQDMDEANAKVRESLGEVVDREAEKKLREQQKNLSAYASDPAWNELQIQIDRLSNSLADFTDEETLNTDKVVKKIKHDFLDIEKMIIKPMGDTVFIGTQTQFQALNEFKAGVKELFDAFIKETPTLEQDILMTFDAERLRTHLPDNMQIEADILPGGTNQFEIINNMLIEMTKNMQDFSNVGQTAWDKFVGRFPEIAEIIKELGKAIKNQLVNVMGQFAENLGYAISGAGDFKTAFKDMLKGILPDVMKLIGLGLLHAAAAPGKASIWLRLGLVAAGAAFLIGSGIVRGLLDKATSNDKDNKNNERPGFQAPGGAGSPVPQSGLGGFNQGDFGVAIDTLTVVVDGQGFQKTILDVIKVDKELKGG